MTLPIMPLILYANVQPWPERENSTFLQYHRKVGCYTYSSDFQGRSHQRSSGSNCFFCPQKIGLIILFSNVLPLFSLPWKATGVPGNVLPHAIMHFVCKLKTTVS